jgi:hypothetical protein
MSALFSSKLLVVLVLRSEGSDNLLCVLGLPFCNKPGRAWYVYMRTLGMFSSITFEFFEFFSSVASATSDRLFFTAKSKIW